MNRQFFPSVSGLLAFESVARHNSVTVAAAELNLTQSAVSRQLRQLEHFLDVELFQRVHQRVLLTEAGRLYLPDVTRVLNDLGRATRRTIIQKHTGASLNLAVPPMLANRWLIPRLPDFLAEHPNARVNMSARASRFDFDAEEYDAAITCDGGDWPAVTSRFLIESPMVPVCSPAFREQHGIVNPSDLAGVSLLYEAGRLRAWPDWFRSAGVNDYEVSQGPSFEHGPMVAQAAVAGLGVALLPKVLIADELRSRLLVQSVDQAFTTSRRYYFVVPFSKASSAEIQRFGDWLSRQASTSRLGGLQLRMPPQATGIGPSRAA